MVTSKYDDYRKLMKVGDVVAFTGKGGFSDLIKNVTKSQFSHVGMIIEAPDIYNAEDRIFIIESTTLNNKPDVDGEYRKGVQMMPLHQRLDGYIGTYHWFPLIEKIPDEKEAEMVKWLLGIHSNRIPYDTAQAIAAGIDCEKWKKWVRWITCPFFRWSFTKEEMNKLFCSEMVSKALQIAGVVDEKINASEETPADVLNYMCFGAPIPLYE